MSGRPKSDDDGFTGHDSCSQYDFHVTKRLYEMHDIFRRDHLLHTKIAVK